MMPICMASFSLGARLWRLPWRLVTGSAEPMAAPPLSSAIISSRGRGPNSVSTPVTSVARVGSVPAVICSSRSPTKEAKYLKPTGTRKVANRAVPRSVTRWATSPMLRLVGKVLATIQL